MKQFKTTQDFRFFESLIYTPWQYITTYFKTPNVFNTKRKNVSRDGNDKTLYLNPTLIMWEKKYSDMYNGNIWIDDSIVMSSSFK